jgi:hypothetical protein
MKEVITNIAILIGIIVILLIANKDIKRLAKRDKRNANR